jgi:hypothetical protein
MRGATTTSAAMLAVLLFAGCGASTPATTPAPLVTFTTAAEATPAHTGTPTPAGTLTPTTTPTPTPTAILTATPTPTPTGAPVDSAAIVARVVREDTATVYLTDWG